MQRLLVRLVLSLAIAALFLWLATRSVAREIALVSDGVSPWVLVWSAARSVPLDALMVYVGLFVVVHLAKLVRWAVQVRPLGERDTWKVLRIGAVGNAAIVTLPLRLGEVVRPALLARESRLSFATAMGTAVVERVVDGLVLVGLLGLMVWVVPEATPLLRHAALLCALIFVGAAGGVLLFVASRGLAQRLLHGVLGRISSGLAVRVDGLLAGFVDGLGSLRRGGVLWSYLGLTAIYWGLNVASLVLLARAFGFPLGWLEGAGVLGVLVAGILLPAGPGFFGNFQLFLAEGLRLVLPGVVLGAAGLAFALVMNVVQVAVQVAFAVIALPATGLSAAGLVALGSRPDALSGTSEEPPEKGGRTP